MELQKLKKYLLKLTRTELKELRDDAAKLLDAHTGEGVAFGQAVIELKKIRKSVPKIELDENGEPRPVFEPDENGNPRMVYEGAWFGPYAYIRQWLIDDKGRLTLTTNGYYGKGGADAVMVGHGDLLLEAHVRGGEREGDMLLMQLRFTPPKRKPSANDLLPSTRPMHPLNDESINSNNLQSQPLYRYFLQYAPIDAAELLAKIKNFERDLAMFEWANEEGLKYRDSMATIEAKRKRAKRKRGNPIAS